MLTAYQYSHTSIHKRNITNSFSPLLLFLLLSFLFICFVLIICVDGHLQGIPRNYWNDISQWRQFWQYSTLSCIHNMPTFCFITSKIHRCHSTSCLQIDLCSIMQQQLDDFSMSPCIAQIAVQQPLNHNT